MAIDDQHLQPNPLEGANYQLSFENGLLTVPLFEVLLGGDLYATQDWVRDSDIVRAARFNEGHQTPDYPRFPMVYWATLNGRIIFIVGDGHHRIADAIINGVPIRAEVDVELPEMSMERLTTPRLAQIKYAKFGLYGIWPFSNFLQRYIERRDLLVPTASES